MDQATEQRAQIFSIPNLMSMFRIVLIPFFAAAVLQGRTIAAIALIAVSALTDVADGYVARRFPSGPGHLRLLPHRRLPRFRAPAA